jgi:hypothetical protein
MNTTQSYFKGMAEAKITDRNDYLEPDQKYVLKIKKTFVFATRNKGDAFIAEMEVVSTTSKSAKMAPGRTVSWYQSLTKKDVAFSAIKLFCYAALGVARTDANAETLKEIDKKIEPLMQEAVEKNSFVNTLVECETASRIAKEQLPGAGTPGGPPVKTFTNHKWEPGPKT